MNLTVWRRARRNRRRLQREMVRKKEKGGKGRELTKPFGLTSLGNRGSYQTGRVMLGQKLRGGVMPRVFVLLSSSRERMKGLSSSWP